MTFVSSFSFSSIFSLHRAPWNPEGQEHDMASSDVGTHVPPFKHGLYGIFWHGFLSSSHVEPMNFDMQLHFHFPFSELHFPPFLHGEDSHGSVFEMNFISHYAGTNVIDNFWFSGQA